MKVIIEVKSVGVGIVHLDFNNFIDEVNMVRRPATPETEILSLNVPTTIKLYLTEDQLAILVACNRELKLERMAHGQLIVNPPTDLETEKLKRRITEQLNCWHEDNKNLGKLFDSSTGFALHDGAIFSPDASWISQEYWDTLTETQRGTFANISPNFVVELRSHSDTLKSLQEKMQEYMENGSLLGWLIDPQNRTVEVYRFGSEVEVLSNPTELSGEKVVPGFVLDLRRVWD